MITLLEIFLVGMFSLGGTYGRTPVISNDERLYRDLTGDPLKAIPKLDLITPVQVNTTFLIRQIERLDARFELFVATGVFEMKWHNPYLAWDPEEYGYISTTMLPWDSIWSPPAFIMNSVLEMSDESWRRDISTRVFSDGSCWMFFGGKFEVSCALDMAKYPFDSQTCYINGTGANLVGLAFWVRFDGKSNSRGFGTAFKTCPGLLAVHKLDVVKKMGTKRERSSLLHSILSLLTSDYDVAYVSDEIVDLSVYQENGEWVLLRGFMTDGSIGGTQVFSVGFNLRRKPKYYLLNIVVPCVILTLLNLAIFCMPSDTGEKTGFGVTVLLSYTVFILLIADSIPRTSDHMPYLAVFLVASMIESAMTTVAAITVLMLHHKPPGVRMPDWLKCVVQNLAVIVCVGSCDRRQNVEVKKHSSVASTVDVNRHTNGHQPGLESVDLAHRITSPLQRDYEDNWQMLASPQIRDMSGHLVRILEEIQVLRYKIELREQDDSLQEDWKMAANVLDRLYFYLGVLVVTALLLFFVFTTM